MARKHGTPAVGKPSPAAKAAALFAVLLFAFALAGCQLGPIEVGGPTATPAPTNTPTITPIPPTPTTAPRPVSGSVQDAYSGNPIAGAEIAAGNVLTETSDTGAYSFDDLPAGTILKVNAPGYAPAETDTGSSNLVAVKLRPNTLSGKVTDGATGKPLEGVLVKLMPPAGQAAASMPVTSTVQATAEATIAPNLATPTTTGMNGAFPGLAAPAAVTQVATAESGTPASTATPLPPTPTPTPTLAPPTGDGFVAVYTDAGGNYSFKDVPQGASLSFKMPGYKLTRLPVGDTARKDMAMEQFHVNAIYVTANIAASPDLFDPLIDWASKSRINAVVLNVQDDASAWVFDVKNKDVIAADNTDIFLKNMPEIVKGLQDKGFYVIARVVTFQQKKMAEARPDWAVKSSVTGKPWKGGYSGQQRWLDASNPAAQDHMIAMTKEVLQLGFDEIQYDYIRFPSDPAPTEPGNMVFATMPLTDTGKTLALQQFFKKAYEVILPTDAFMSADVFGYSLWPDQEDGPILGVIGQVLPYLLPYSDYLSPMIYPSHFSPGEQGCAKPATCAYTLVHKSGEYAAELFKGHKAKYRPWLQDFDWPGADYTSPGTTKVAEQIQACAETGCWGWMMWDAANDYEPRAVFKK